MLGWSAAGLEQARAFARDIGSDAVLIVDDGRIVQQWGNITETFPVYSVRKSLLNSLIGMAVAEEALSLDDTLETLGIDDRRPSLSAAEKQARVRDLLTARSGVYHKAAYESRSHDAARPARGAHPPGKHFYYNNWDFNTLGTIYSQAVGEDLFKSFARRVATPVGMEDFTLADTEYHSERSSDHPAYLFKMSARDLARFGLLYLRGGQWRDAQVVPEEWVAASTATQVSAATENRSYGYMWWTYPQYGPYFGAAASGGQNLVVDPTRGLVIVHQAKENWFGSGGVGPEFWRLYGMIVSAAPQP